MNRRSPPSAPLRVLSLVLVLLILAGCGVVTPPPGAAPAQQAAATTAPVAGADSQSDLSGELTPTIHPLHCMN